MIAADVSAVFLNTADFGITITYKRGVTVLGNAINALVGESQFEVAQDFGFTRHETRDYLIAVGSISSLPQRGDTITEGTNVYTVTSPGGGPAYRYEDEDWLMLRIHSSLTTGS